MSSSGDFSVELTRELLRDACRSYPWHRDPDRFPGPRLTKRIRKRIKALLTAITGRFLVSAAGAPDPMDCLQGRQPRFDALHDALADQASRDELVKVMAYRLLGPDWVRLPLDTPAYWRDRAWLRSLVRAEGAIEIKSAHLRARCYELASIGFPLRLYSNILFVHATFRTRQYEYPALTPPLKAEPGDIVIDAGGCWGDTALYFAHETGPAGRVYTVEFQPDNLSVLARNLELNPEPARSVVVVDRPVWSESGVLLNFAGTGTGGRLAVAGTPRLAAVPPPPTISIDDLAAERGLPRVDFLKMDIEGAELPALRGAAGVLRRFKPKLAISIYHSLEDMTAIREHLASLDLGYRFYLRHCSTYAEETILFADARPVPPTPAEGP